MKIPRKHIINQRNLVILIIITVMKNSIYESDQKMIFSGKKLKIQHDNTKHYPNKDEASLLRKLMTETGLSEKEVRDIKKYRIMLSDAQKLGQKPKRSEANKHYQNMIKDACKQTGLVPQHPDTLKILNEMLQNGGSKYWYRKRWWMISSNPTAKTIVRDYAK